MFLLSSAAASFALNIWVSCDQQREDDLYTSVSEFAIHVHMYMYVCHSVWEDTAAHFILYKDGASRQPKMHTKILPFPADAHFY